MIERHANIYIYIYTHVLYIYIIYVYIYIICIYVPYIYVCGYVIEPLNMVVWDIENIDGHVDMFCEKLSDSGWIMAQLLTSYHVYLVGGLEHFGFFHILGIITSTD